MTVRDSGINDGGIRSIADGGILLPKPTAAGNAGGGRRRRRAMSVYMYNSGIARIDRLDY